MNANSTKRALFLLVLTMPAFEMAADQEDRYSERTSLNGENVLASLSTNSAVKRLIGGAQEDLHEERVRDAATKAERAVRIEPTDPAAWHMLAKVRLYAKEFSQAEIMAGKSMALAPSDSPPELKPRNLALINTAAGRGTGGQLADGAGIEKALEKNLTVEIERQRQIVVEQRERQEALAQAETQRQILLEERKLQEELAQAETQGQILLEERELQEELAQAETQRQILLEERELQEALAQAETQRQILLEEHELQEALAQAETQRQQEAESTRTAELMWEDSVAIERDASSQATWPDTNEEIVQVAPLAEPSPVSYYATTTEGGTPEASQSHTTYSEELMRAPVRITPSVLRAPLDRGTPIASEENRVY